MTFKRIMKTAKIEGGYYIKARRIQESEIAHAPPHVREIWDWFIKEANHKDIKQHGQIFNRGQCVRSYKDIQNGLSWYVGFRKMTYSKNDCETAMNWLRKHTMIHTKKTTRGMIVTICNYNLYQNPKNYETYNETYAKHTMNIQTPDTINKNDKNVKKEKKDIIPSFFNTSDFLTTLQNFKKMRTKIKKPLTDYAEGLLIAKLDRLSGQDCSVAIEIMENSILGSYQGVFELKKNGKVSTKSARELAIERGLHKPK